MSETRTTKKRTRRRRTSKEATARAPGANPIRLLHRHTHAGQRFEAGDLVTVGDAEARWLVSNGIGEAADNS